MDGEGFVQQGRNNVNWGVVAKVGDINAGKQESVGKNKKGFRDQKKKLTLRERGVEIVCECMRS